VFRDVGDVADKVSSLRLVAFLPKIGVTLLVFNVNRGRFEGVGVGVRRVGILGRLYVAGEDGNTASDIVCAGAYGSGSGDAGGIRASIAPEAPGS
jgi:hypothetical protein